MDESDTMLINSLKDYINIPQQIQSLRDIRTEHIFSIASSLFEYLGINHEELKTFTIKTQRFRAMTKLTQTINQQLDSSYELNDIMNPTVGFLRKLIISMITKIGSSQPGDGKGKISKQSSQLQERKRQKKLLKNWLSSEWIMPELDTNPKVTYEPHRLRIGIRKDIFKRNMIPELSNVNGNAHTIMQSALTFEKIERKKKEAEEGINRKQQEQISRNIYQIIKNNQNDWIQAEKKKRKIKKKLFEKDDSSEAKPETVFQHQVSELAAQNKKNINSDKVVQSTISTEVHEEEMVNPIERIKRECEAKQNQLQRKLQEIINLLNSKRAQIQQQEELKSQLQQQIGQYEDRVQYERERRTQVKKDAQKMKILLDSIEAGQQGVSSEVKQLEQQYNFIESEANKQIEILENQIRETKEQGTTKLQILRQLKMKLSKIELDYQNVVDEIQDKAEIKDKVKIHKSGISRLYYSKKISEMEVRWRDTQKQVNKISAELQKEREQIRRLLFLADRLQTEIQNTISSSRFKDDAENKLFKDMFMKCENAFKETVKAIQNINITKNDIQEYEAKVHSLSGKEYVQNIKKIKSALDELHKEISQAQKKSK